MIKDAGEDGGKRSPPLFGPPSLPDPHHVPEEPKLNVRIRCALVLKEEIHEPGLGPGSPLLGQEEEIGVAIPKARLDQCSRLQLER
jgi:hypothetical protein